jgi:hypothetical protein
VTDVAAVRGARALVLVVAIFRAYADRKGRLRADAPALPRDCDPAALDLGGVVYVCPPRCHMTGSVCQPSPVLAINLNGPTSFVHWSIFYLTVANLVAAVGAHVLLVRVRGVSHPIGARTAGARGGSGRRRRRAISAAGAAPWRGPVRRYDVPRRSAW